MMKRNHLCAGLAMIMALGFLLLWHHSAEAAANDVARYSALVLDLSGSMSGASLTELKKACKNFCAQVLGAQGYNYVAVINFSGTVWSDFTNDPDILNAAIDKMSGGASDPLSGLQKASTLFSPDDIIRNIIVMGDGVANYEPSIKEAEALWEDHHIYSMGFFQNLSEYGKLSSRENLYRLQNAGYYEVVNGDDLDLRFGDIGFDITNGDNTPIIYVPGILGSDLRDLNSYLNVWPVAPDERIEYPKPLGVQPWDEVQQIQSTRNYGTLEHAKDLIDGLCKAFPVKLGQTQPDRPVYVFSYDWRYSNAFSANRLSTFVDTLIKDEVKKVDIVAHSMGGLVASYYFKTNASKVNRIITIATPYEGAPELIYRAMSEKTTGTATADRIFSHFGALSPEVKRNFPSMPELAPTTNYMNIIPMRKSKTYLPESKPSVSIFTDPTDPVSISEYRNMYSPSIFGATNAGNAAGFQAELLGDSGFNILRSYSNAFFFTGGGQHTMTEVVFDPNGNGNVLGAHYDSRGDGTVPYLSATMMEQINSLPSTRRMSFVGGHGEVLKNDTLIRSVINVLKTGNAFGITETGAYNPRGYTVVHIACPVDATISKDGEILTSRPSSFNDRASFGRMDIFNDDETKVFCVDDGAFPVRLEGTGTGTMDYSIGFFDKDNKLIEERTFRNVEITSATIITTNTSRSARTVLDVDDDGDGKVDRTLSPEDGNQNTTFTVTFNSQGGSAVTSATVASGAKVTKPTDPTRSGYTFAGWYKESACLNVWNFSTDTVTASVTLYAKWTFGTPTYTVTFDSQGGSAVTSVTVGSGARVTRPIDPTRSGYIFAGWYREFACLNAWDFSADTVAANVTLYAKWSLAIETPTYAVTFNSQGGSIVQPVIVNVTSGSRITKPAIDPTRAGYVFGGWHREPACWTAWDFSTDTVTANVILYAKWTPISNTNPPVTVVTPVNSGGGGCDAGIGSVVMLALMAGVVAAQKRK